MTRHLLRHRGGAIALEFAVLAPIYFGLLVSLLELARYTWLRNAVQQIAFDGARCAGLRAVSCSDAPTSSGGSRTFSATKTQSYIIGIAGARGIRLAAGNLTINDSTTCSGVASVTRVIVTGTFNSPVLAPFGLDDQTIASTVCYGRQI